MRSWVVWGARRVAPEGHADVAPGSLIEVLLEVSAYLKSRGIPHMLIGGIATTYWGEPRATLDVDLSVLVPDAELSKFLERLPSDLAPRAPQPVLEFIERTRVLPLRHSSGINIDLVFAVLPFEEEALERAIEVPIEGSFVRVVSAEDLVLMKIFSERPKDRGDVATILSRRWLELDHGYLEPRVIELSHLMEDPSILDRYRAGRPES